MADLPAYAAPYPEPVAADADAAAEPAPPTVTEVPAAAEPASPPKRTKRLRYELREAPPAYHIYEATTGKRVTAVPLTDRPAAEERAARWTEEQTAP